MIRGGDIFVAAASRIAKASGAPDFVIGATVVSVATTLPELLVSVIAASQGRADMAAGNAVGSVTANTALIRGLVIVLAPAAVERRAVLKKAVILFAAVLLLWLFSLSGTLAPAGAGVMLGVFAFYIFDTLMSAKAPSPVRAPDGGDKRRAGLKNALSFIIGAAAVASGSRLLVDSGSQIAREIFRVDGRVISLTLVAVGTSLPEFVTAVTAVRRRQTALAAGNIIGANIIDSLLILPVCSLIRGGLPVSLGALAVDLPVCLLSVIITLVPALIKGRFMRLQGVIALLLYIIYMINICFPIVI